MRNTTVAKIVKILSRLLEEPIPEMVRDGFFRGMDLRPIHTYRNKHSARVVGRKWLAPLYRPVLGAFTAKPGMFFYVRENKRFCDVEFVDKASGEAVIYTIAAQEWREKQGYFELIPPDRFKGSLGDFVRHITQLRRSNANQRREISTRTASSLISSD
jgi:hypothetical protein